MVLNTVSRMKTTLPASFLSVAAIAAAFSFISHVRAAGLTVVARDPYASAIVVDADTGKVIFEDRADMPVYPASIVKLMPMLILIERIEQGLLDPSEKVKVTADITRIGGTQVWLKEGEVFTVEELMYAMMIRSANDAAAALAEHVAGTRANFVEMMNERAKRLGMTSTRYSTVHGLPPSAGQKADISTARDQAILAMELARHKGVFTYTGERKRDFRPDAPIGGGRVEMINHNPLLGEVEGCDGFKTGYFSAAGFSIVATAKRNGRRVIAVVMGSKTKEARNAKAKELLAKGFLELPPYQPEPTAASATSNAPPAVAEEKPQTRFWTGKRIAFAVVGAVAIIWGVAALLQRRARPAGLEY